MKVLNGLVHGDTRGHVILSPGVIGATANHTCESIGIMVNTAFKEHGCLPSLLSVQFDGATTNKCSLVLAYMGLYVMEGVFTTARARCELESHAHDVYDAYQAIHAGRVKHSTYYHLEELRAIMRAAHDRVRDEDLLRPVVGHDVKVNSKDDSGERQLGFRFGSESWLLQVSNLWVLRDFWEWLAPGYSDTRTRDHALANAAFTSYFGMNKFREFKMELEAGSTPANPKVGLWAKAYMTTEEYTYLGTLLSKSSFQSATCNRLPATQSRQVSDQKTTRETKGIEKLTSASRGPYKEQFSAERLADALAMCRRDWGHFDSSPGKLQPHELWLPQELAQAMRQAGRRPDQSVPSVPSVQSAAEQGAADVLLDADVNHIPKVEQRHHTGAAVHGLSTGSGITARAGPSRAPTDKEFLARLVTPGSFVITRPAANGPWAKTECEQLVGLHWWLWQVTKVLHPGAVVPGFTKPAETFTYEAHLYQPIQAASMKGRWTKVYDDVRPAFMRTTEEKSTRKVKVKIWGIENKKKWSGQGNKFDALQRPGELLMNTRTSCTL